jgi:hypothetical protein
MRLVPKQLRRTDFPGSVPYFGGRLTPWVIAGINKPAPGGSVDATELRVQLADALTFLSAHGVMTEPEHDAIAARIDGVR